MEPPIGNWMTAQLSKDLPQIFGPPASAELEAHMQQFMNRRLSALETLMADREWIVGDFSAADIILVDVLRVLLDSGALTDFPALTDYIARATARPAFKKAMQDHMAHWTAADAARQS